MLNENAISNVLNDIDFIEDELKRLGRQHICVVFNELRSVSQVVDMTGYKTHISVDHFDTIEQCSTRVPSPNQQINIIRKCETQTITGSLGETE